MGGTGRVMAVAVGQVGGRDLVVCGGYGGTVWEWDAVSGDLVGIPFTGHTGNVHAVAIGRLGAVM